MHEKQVIGAIIFALILAGAIIISVETLQNGSEQPVETYTGPLKATGSSSLAIADKMNATLSMSSRDFISGNTIVLTATFKDTYGNVSDLDAAPDVKLLLADKVTQSGTLHNSSKDSTGIYHYNLTLPSTEGIYYVQFSGNQSNETVIYREPIMVVFA